jgi:hypothetical protein
MFGSPVCDGGDRHHASAIENRNRADRAYLLINGGLRQSDKLLHRLKRGLAGQLPALVIKTTLTARITRLSRLKSPSKRSDRYLCNLLNYARFAVK